MTCLKGATTGLMRRSKAEGDYSINSSAHASSAGGTVRPSALAEEGPKARRQVTGFVVEIFMPGATHVSRGLLRRAFGNRASPAYAPPRRSP